MGLIACHHTPVANVLVFPFGSGASGVRALPCLAPNAAQKIRTSTVSYKCMDTSASVIRHFLLSKRSSLAFLANSSSGSEYAKSRVKNCSRKSNTDILTTPPLVFTSKLRSASFICEKYSDAHPPFGPCKFHYSPETSTNGPSNATQAPHHSTPHVSCYIFRRSQDPIKAHPNSPQTHTNNLATMSGKQEDDHEATKAAASDSRIAKASSVSAAQLFQATDNVDDLTPPADVSFFKVDDFTVFNSHVLSVGGNVKAQITWKIKTYMYATKVDPRKPDEYAKHGGETFLIIVHSGSVMHSPASSLKELQFQVQINPDELSVNSQLPPSNSGTKDDKNWKYTIDFAKTLAMLKNDGQDIATFKANYVEPFTRVGCKQTATLVGEAWQQFSIIPDNKDAMGTQHSIHGLTVLSTKRGGDWKPQMQFWYKVFTTDPLGPYGAAMCPYYPSLNFE